MQKKFTEQTSYAAIEQDLEAGYRLMAADKSREAEALEWAEATIEEYQNDRGVSERW